MHLALQFAIALIVASGSIGAGSTDIAPGVPTEIPGRTLPVVREHTYRMAGKIRLVMLWEDATMWGLGSLSDQLRLIESTLLARFERDGRTWHDVIRARFETGETGTRSGTRFELVYGAAGALSGIPIVISYQPKWWLQVDLVLNR
jgi:hypothetical protein